MRVPKRLFFLTIVVLLLFLAGCSPLGGNQSSNGGNGGSTPTVVPAKSTATPTAVPQIDTCPQLAGNYPAGTFCYTPHQLQVAYGVQSLLGQGYTGKGQTIVDIVSFGSPFLQQDMDAFDKQFNLPPITIQIVNPLGTKQFDPSSKDMTGWLSETTLDVQIMHAIAPDAKLVVLTSPVSETEGTIGLPEFLQLEQYAVDHYPGSIVSQSWGASEVTLKNAAGQQELQKWTSFYQKATTQQKMTYLSSSGDNGATDYSDLQSTTLSPVATTSFPADEPWVTSVGGTTVIRNGTTTQEKAWQGSGGGFSSFYSTPSYQQTLPSSVQGELNHRRGVPDVSAAADPTTGLAVNIDGQWALAGGTSASAPLWAAIMAIGNQMAGHSLGFINPGLYKLVQSSTYAQDFHDVTLGNNDVNSKGVQLKGYPAVPGWDPVTGLGTPNAEKLLPNLIAAMK